METEQNKTLEALQMAIQMEIDGKEYYQRVSRSSNNQIGRELFQSLATEEDIHRQKFAKIYDALRNKKAWPKTSFQPERGKRLKTIFGKAIEAMDSNIKAPPTELDAIQTAMDMENKTYDFYKSQNTSAIYDDERDFYQALAAAERGHYLVLHDYRESLFDPASCFT